MSRSTNDNKNWLATGSSDDEDDTRQSSEDEREVSRSAATKTRIKRRRLSKDEDEEDLDRKLFQARHSQNDMPEQDPEDDSSIDDLDKDEEDFNDEDLIDEDEEEDMDDYEGPPIAEGSNIFTNAAKLKPLSKSQLEASKVATEKTGVVYLSRIPPFMKPFKVKHLLSQFGPTNRIFLSPESPKSYALRKRFGGNKKRNFEEGWVEFVNKKDAKLCAEALNANSVGGKKGNYYYDDVWNIKYLPKFKWHHLTEQISNENASRQARLRAEISQSTRETKAYIQNVERAKMLENMQASKKRKSGDEGGDDTGGTAEKAPAVEVRRQFKQRSAVTKARKNGEASGENGKKADAMKTLMGKIF